MLAKAGSRPDDLDGFDCRSITQSDLLREGRASVAAAGRNGRVQGAVAVRRLHFNGDAGADRAPVRFCADELQGDPVVGVTGIKEDGARENVTGKFAAEYLENVEGAVCI